VSRWAIGGVRMDVPVVLAPMAAVTNPPFRLLCREMGAGLVVTEMIHAEALVAGGARSVEMLDIRPTEHPVAVQLFGGDPDIMARAAALVEAAGADMVDINFGCPMKKVVRNGLGAALLKRPERVGEIVAAMTGAVGIPVMAKIRAGWDDSNVVAVGRAIEDAGGAAITIHGRTQSDGFEGLADLRAIAELVEAVCVPVIGNGDVRDAASAQTMMDTTGCAAVMVGRGCMGYPWVFRELRAHFQGAALPGEPSLAERRSVVLRHIQLYADTYGERRTALQIRKHLLWYFRGTPGEQVLKSRLAGLSSVSDVRACVNAATDACAAGAGVRFPRGLDKHPNRRQTCRDRGAMQAARKAS
jgi:tRNA-dihydrouridine synthase B